MNNETVGRYISELRQEKNLTQTDLAKLCSVTYQAVSQWETGKTLPDIDSLKNLSEIFNLTINEILEGKENDLQRKEEEAVSETGIINEELKAAINPNVIFSIILVFVTLILLLAGLVGRNIQLMILPAFIITMCHSLHFILNKNINILKEKYINFNKVLKITSAIFFVISVIIFIGGIMSGGLQIFGVLQPFIYIALTLNYYFLEKKLK